MIRVELTPAEIDLIRSALDSHAYWQIAPDHARKDGFVRADFLRDDDDEVRARLVEVEALDAKLAAVVHHAADSRAGPGLG